MTGQTYNAQEHTVTEDGCWPICAGCGAYGSHEACVRAEDDWWWDARRRARAVAAPAGVSATRAVEVMTLARPLSPPRLPGHPGLRAAGHDPRAGLAMTALTLPVALAALGAAAALTAAASLRAHGYLTVREVTCLVICIGTVVVVFWFG